MKTKILLAFMISGIMLLVVNKAAAQGPSCQCFTFVNNTNCTIGGDWCHTSCDPSCQLSGNFSAGPMQTVTPCTPLVNYGECGTLCPNSWWVGVGSYTPSMPSFYEGPSACCPSGMQTFTWDNVTRTLTVNCKP